MSSRARVRRSKKATERSADRPSRRRPVTTAWREAALGLACIALAILLLAMDTSLLNVFDLAKAAYSHAAAWLLLGVLLLVAAADGVRIPRSPLFIAFYCVVGVEVLTTATATNRYVALYGEVGRYLGLTTYLVFALVAIAIAVGLDYPHRASWLGWTLAAASLVAAGYAGLQAIGADPIKWADLDSHARPFGTTGNPDFYGQFASVAVVASAAVVLFTVSRPRVRLAAAALGLVNLVMLLVTSTRGAVIGVVAGAVVLGVLWIRRAGATRSALARLSLGGLALVAGLALTVLTTPLGDRLVALTNVENVQDRVRIYTAATRIFLDNPMLGVGFENFAVAYPEYAEPDGVRSNKTQTSAHNWILHLAATSGVAGLAATAGLLVVFALHVWKRARDDDALALLAAAAALAAFYGSGLVLPGAQSIQWIPWACFGVALASDLRTAPIAFRLPAVRLAFLARVLLIVAVAVLAFFQVTPLSANRLAKTAESLLRAETAQRAVDAARAATVADGGRAVYWNDLGRGLELVDDQAGARRAYLEATARSPYTPAFWWNLGRMHVVFARQSEPGAKDAAYGAFSRALEASPRNPDTYDQLARAQLALGDLGAAVTSEERAIALYPGDPRYYTVAADSLRLQGDTSASLEVLRRGVAAATPSNELRLTLARRLIEARSETEARSVLRELLRLDPGNVPATDLLKQIGG